MIRVVTGHICSGKTTYVDANARPGDVVIDCDRIAQALSVRGTREHQHHEPSRLASVAARRQAIAQAIADHRRDALGKPDAAWDVWIVHAYPDDRDMRTYFMADAKVINIECDAATLRERARDRPPSCRNELERRLKAPRGGVPLEQADQR